MALNFKRLCQAYQALRSTENLGDFALLKADGLGAKANPKIAAKMLSVRGYYPYINLQQLIKLPSDTFGYHYALYMQQNKLKPLNISPELVDIATNNVFALRYAVTHDMFHVLLDFDTSYAGEIGVLAFAVAQEYSKLQLISLPIAQLLYLILAPGQIKAIFANRQRGKLMGQKANFLLNYRFEDHWTETLSSLRSKLNINLS